MNVPATVADPIPDCDSAPADGALPCIEGTSVLAVGIPPLAWLLDVLGSRTPSGYEPPIVVLESDAARAAAWIERAAGAGISSDGTSGRVANGLSSGRVRVFAGPTRLDDYAAWRAGDLESVHPTVVVRGDDTSSAADEAHRAVQRAEHACAERRAALCARQAERVSIRLGERPATLRFLAFTTRYSTVVHDALTSLTRALRRASCTVDLIVESTSHAGDVDTFTPLAAGGYDGVITMNRIRSDLDARLDPRIPLVSWLQDHRIEHRHAHSGTGVGPRDVVLAQSRSFLVDHCGFDAAAVIETTNVADVDDAEASLVRGDAVDVVYAGHGSESPEAMIEATAAAPKLRACLHHLLGACRRELCAGTDLSGLVVAALLLESERAAQLGPVAPRARAIELQPLAMQLVDRVLRHETLEWVATWARERGRRFQLHGRGWERHATLAPFAAGVVPPGSDLRRVLRSSRAVVQVNAYGSMHQRLLEPLIVGTPVLTRYNPVDLLAEPHRRLRRSIVREGIESFPALDRLARRDAAVAAVMDELRRLGVPLLAWREPERRERELEFLRAVGARPAGADGLDDWFAVVRDGRLVARRSAGQLPGFAATTFRDAPGLFRGLDAIVAEPGRPSWLAPMREAAARHDTVDALARRLLRRWRLRTRDSS